MCSITRLITAASCTACSPRPPANHTTPIYSSCRSDALSDLNALEQGLNESIAAANDEAALEAVRVAALGRKGAVSELLKTLGAMTPEQRREQGPLINGLKDRITAALAERKAALAQASLVARLNTETIDVTLPVVEPPTETGRIHPISQ